MNKNNLSFIATILILICLFISVLGYYFLINPCDQQCEVSYKEDKNHNEIVQTIDLKPELYTLPNGIQLSVLSTPFESNEVLVRVISLRGYADEAPEKRASAELAMEMAWESGINGKNADQISATLYENGIELSTKVYPFYMKIEANMPTDKLNRFFSLASSFIRNAHVTPIGAETIKAKMVNSLEERERSRNHQLEDIAKKIFFPKISNLQCLKLTDLKQIDYEDADEFIHQATADPSKFMFIVVGDVDPEEVFKMFNSHLGNISPNVQVKKSSFDWSLIDLSHIHGETRYTFPSHHKNDGITKIIFPLNLKVDLESFNSLDLFSHLVEERLRNLLFSISGSYQGVDVSYEFPLYPHLSPVMLSVQFRANPKVSEDTIKNILNNLQELKSNGPSENEIRGVQKFVGQTEDFWRRNNEYWLETLCNYSMWKWPFESIFEAADQSKSLKGELFQELIQNSLNIQDYVIIMGTPT